MTTMIKISTVDGDKLDHVETVPLDEVLDALFDWIESPKVREIGQKLERGEKVILEGYQYEKE